MKWSGLANQGRTKPLAIGPFGEHQSIVGRTEVEQSEMVDWIGLIGGQAHRHQLVESDAFAL
jgi:hypothetical protein